MQDLNGKPVFFGTMENEDRMRKHYFQMMTGENKSHAEIEYFQDLYYKILKGAIQEEKEDIYRFLNGDYRRLEQSEEVKKFINSMMSIMNDIMEEKIDDYTDLETVEAMRNVLLLDNLYKNNTQLKEHVLDPKELANECRYLIAKLTKKINEKK